MINQMLRNKIFNLDLVSRIPSLHFRFHSKCPELGG